MILDVGCGDAPRGDVNVDLFINQTPHIWRPHVIDAKKIPNFMRADAEHLPFRDGMFETVYCCDLIEHFVNPTKCFLELWRVSKRTVLIWVPCNIWSVFFDFVFRGRAGWVRKYHKRQFTTKSLLKIIPFNPVRNAMVTVKLKYVAFADAVLWQKPNYESKLKVPVPFKIEMVVEKNEKMD